MEQLKSVVALKLVGQITEGQNQPSSAASLSTTQPTQSLTALPKLPIALLEKYQPRSGAEKAKLLGNVLAKWRRSQGWQPLAIDDQVATVAVWMEILDAAGVPADAYEDLYIQAVRRQAEKGADDAFVPTFSPELFLQVWPEMRNERRRKFFAQIPQTEKVNCEKCDGRSWVLDNNLGIIECSHRCQECSGGVMIQVEGGVKRCWHLGLQGHKEGGR